MKDAFEAFVNGWSLFSELSGNFHSVSLLKIAKGLIRFEVATFLGNQEKSQHTDRPQINILILF